MLGFTTRKNIFQEKVLKIIARFLLSHHRWTFALYCQKINVEKSIRDQRFWRKLISPLTRFQPFSARFLSLVWRIHPRSWVFAGVVPVLDPIRCPYTRPAPTDSRRVWWCLWVFGGPAEVSRRYHYTPRLTGWRPSSSRQIWRIEWFSEHTREVRGASMHRSWYISSEGAETWPQRPEAWIELSRRVFTRQRHPHRLGFAV